MPELISLASMTNVTQKSCLQKHSPFYYLPCSICISMVIGATAATKVPSLCPRWLTYIGFVSSYFPGARRANTIRCFLLFVGFATGRCGPFGDKWRGCSCIHHFTARDNGGKSSSVLVSSANREPLIGEALAHHVLDVVIEGRTCLW